MSRKSPTRKRARATLTVLDEQEDLVQEELEQELVTDEDNDDQLALKADALWENAILNSVARGDVQPPQMKKELIRLPDKEQVSVVVLSDHPRQTHCI